MGYPNFGKVKTIVLPIEFDFIDACDGESWSFVVELYKEKFGIDLDELIEFNDTSKGIYVKSDAQILLRVMDNHYPEFPLGTLVPYIKSYHDTRWEENSSAGVCLIALSDNSADAYSYGFSITIPKTEAFTKDNAVIGVVDL